MKALICLDCRIRYLWQIADLRIQVEKEKRVSKILRDTVKRYEDLMKISDDIEYNEIPDILSDDEETEDEKI